MTGSPGDAMIETRRLPGYPTDCGYQFANGRFKSAFILILKIKLSAFFYRRSRNRPCQIVDPLQKTTLRKVGNRLEKSFFGFRGESETAVERRMRLFLK